MPEVGDIIRPKSHGFPKEADLLIPLLDDLLYKLAVDVRVWIVLHLQLKMIQLNHL